MTNSYPLILDAKPQEKLSALLIKKFTKDKRVDQVIQRGSFAKRQTDRASDIDLLVVLQDEFVTDFLGELDSLVGSCCALMASKGWVDTIVPDFGGVGFVYLASYDQRLIQLDVYVTLSSWSERIVNFPEKKIVYTRHSYLPNFNRLPDGRAMIEKYIADAEKEYQIIFEFLLLVVMQIKHIYRARATLAVKYRYAVIESLAVFLRLVFTPDRIGYKMYDWENDFQSISAPSIKAFERMLTTINIYSIDEVFALVQIFETVLYESHLQKRYKEFKPLIQAIEIYSKALLTPTYG